MKPSPENIVDLYWASLDALGFDTTKNDTRLVEDDWESQAAGASGVGWEVWVNGAEISQFTFFQQMGGIECDPVCAEITYGPERLCLMLDGAKSFWEDLRWNETLTYRDVDFQLEMQDNVYNFEVASVEMLTQLFEMYEAESKRVIETPMHWDPQQAIYTTNSAPGPEAPKNVGPGWMIYPALDLALKCSHVFNLLDARGAVGVTQRAEYINRIRARVRACCLKHVEQFKVAAKA